MLILTLSIFSINPIALRKAKIVYSFGLNECNRVKNILFLNTENGQVFGQFSVLGSWAKWILAFVDTTCP